MQIILKMVEDNQPPTSTILTENGWVIYANTYDEDGELVEQIPWGASIVE